MKHTNPSSMKEAEPLERKSIAAGSTMKPALDVYWIEPREYTQYCVLQPAPDGDGSEVEDWCDMMVDLERDCRQLLALDHHRFWSQLIFGPPSLRDMLDSYLQRCPRIYERAAMRRTFFSFTERVARLQWSVHKRIFLIFLRLSTHKESADSFITPVFFGNLVLKHSLFNVPRMLDLCALYADVKGKLVYKMLENVLKYQGKFERDMLGIAKCTIERLEDVHKTLRSLKRGIFSNSASNQNDVTELNSVVLFLVDMSFSLNRFFELCPLAVQKFYESGFIRRIPEVYDETLNDLLKFLQALAAKKAMTEEDVIDCKGQLAFIQASLLQCFRAMVEECCLKTREKKTAQQIDEYLELLLGSMQLERFMTAYAEKYAFWDDMTRVEAEKFVDDKRLQFISDGMHSLLLQAGHTESSKPNKVMLVENDTGPSIPSATAHSDATTRITTQKQLSSATTTPEVTNLSKNVKELFPQLQLSDAFLQECLNFYGNSGEAVLDAMLCMNLPPHLQATLNTIEDDTPSSSTQQASATFDTLSDEDKLGPVRDDSELRRLDVSKKRGTANVLNDKSDVTGTAWQSFYRQYEFEMPDWQETEDGQVVELLYEDEYDDTYDSHPTGAGEDDETADEKAVIAEKALSGAAPSGSLRANAPAFTSTGGGPPHQQPTGGSGKQVKPQPSQQQQQRHNQGPPAARDRTYQTRPLNQPLDGADLLPAQTNNVEGQRPQQQDQGRPQHDRQWKERHKGRIAGHNRKELASKKYNQRF